MARLWLIFVAAIIVCATQESLGNDVAATRTHDRTDVNTPLTPPSSHSSASVPAPPSRSSAAGVDVHERKLASLHASIQPRSPPVYDDWHYPTEELEEAALTQDLRLLSADEQGQTCSLANQSGTAPAARVGGDAVLGGWVVLSVIPISKTTRGVGDSGGGGLVCVVERRFARWGVLVFLSPEASVPVLSLRTSVGTLPSLEPLQKRYESKLVLGQCLLFWTLIISTMWRYLWPHDVRARDDDKIASIIRLTGTRICACIIAHLGCRSFNYTAADPSYWEHARDDPSDYLGTQILADGHGEPT